MVNFTSMQLGGHNERRGQICIHVMRWHNEEWSILHPCNWEGKIREEDKFTSM
jgi:hypothetical protein